MERFRLFTTFSKRKIKVSEKSCTYYWSQSSSPLERNKFKVIWLIEILSNIKSLKFSQTYVILKRAREMQALDKRIEVKYQSEWTKNRLELKILEKQANPKWLRIKKCKEKIVSVFRISWKTYDKRAQKQKYQNSSNKWVFTWFTKQRWNCQKRHSLSIVCGNRDKEIKEWVALQRSTNK